MRSAADSILRRRPAKAARAVPAYGLTLALAAVVAVSWSRPARSDEATPVPPAPGIWQSHKYSFQFMGFTSTYSCDGLADKLRVLLLAAGARSDVKSQPGACASPFGRPDKFARADLVFATLAPVAGNFLPDGKPVYGRWRSVTFTSRSPPELQLGDCEVVEQFRSQVLPMFATRNVVSNTTCIPNQESGSVIDLRFEVFAPLPAAKH